jgi:hypothetical protein
MLRRRTALAEGARSVAASGDVTNTVIVAGDHATVHVRVDGPDALLAPQRGADPRVHPRTPPLDVRPAPSPLHIDRDAETAALVSDPGPVVELYGVPGIGKSFLLAHALAEREARTMPDGVVYQFVQGAWLDDILQSLFETFYECQPAFKASPDRLRREIEDKRALIVLDGVDISREDVQRLVMAAPGCRFVLASREPVLGEGRLLQLEGLAVADGLAVVEQELGRSLLPRERSAAERICTALAGHPFSLRQAAAVARDGDRTLEALAGDLDAADPVSALGERLLETLFDHERGLLSQFAAFREAAIGTEHVRALVERPDVHRGLELLERRRVVASESGRYRLAGVVAGLFAERDEEAADRALHHFVSTADEQQRPGWALSDARAVQELLAWAAETGRLHETVWLGRAIGSAFAWGRRWDAWERVLTIVLDAATELADSRSEAWAVHQLGVRAWCLGEVEEGVDLLERALKTREELGESAGAAATRHNLDVVRRLGAGADAEQEVAQIAMPERPREREDRGAGPWRWVLAGMLACIATIVLAIMALANRGDDEPERAEVPVEPTGAPPATPDTTRPRVTITVPRHTTYRAGTDVKARFRCRDDHPQDLKCDAVLYPGKPVGVRRRPPNTADELDNGDPINTSLGARTLRVTARDAAGHKRVKEVWYSVELKLDDPERERRGKPDPGR